MKRLFVALLLVALASFAACSKETTPTEEDKTPLSMSTENALAIETILKESGKTEKIGEADQYTNILHYSDADNTKLWLGNIFYGSSLEESVYREIPIELSPKTITIINIAGSKVSNYEPVTIRNPSLAGNDTGITNLINETFKDGDSTPGNSTFNFYQVYSERDMNLHISSNASFANIGKSSRTFDWNKETSSNRIVVSYEVEYYTLAISPNSPYKAYEYFSATTSADEVRDVLSNDSKPVYLSTITYGAKAYKFIETSHSYEKVKAAIESSLKIKMARSDVNISSEHKQILDELRIKFLVIGGSHSSESDHMDGYEVFNEIVDDINTFSAQSPGIALRCTFNNLSDNTTAFFPCVPFTPYEYKVKVGVSNVEFMASESARLTTFHMNGVAFSSEGEITTSERQNIWHWNSEEWHSKGDKLDPINYNVNPVTFTLDTRDTRIEDYSFKFWITTEYDDNSQYHHYEIVIEGDKLPKVGSSAQYELELGNHTLNFFIKIEE